MAAGSHKQDHRTDYTRPECPETGSFRDMKTRSVTRMNGSDNCLGVNLSEAGSVILGVTPEDDLNLVIFENGIWIPKK